MTLQFLVKTASEEEIKKHLYSCSPSFQQSLEQKVCICEYSKKIFQKAVTFEAWDKGVLVGVVAVYLNGLIGTSGYITNVSVVNEYTSRGIAGNLLINCLKEARALGIKTLSLEVNCANHAALHLYKKFGFRENNRDGDKIFMTFTIL